MNLTGRPVYKKGQRLVKRSNAPTKQDRVRWSEVAALGCVAANGVGTSTCAGRITIQHCLTGMGRQKDHSKVIPLCWEHHLGKEGIDGKQMSKPAWEAKYGTETILLEKVKLLLRIKHE